MVLKVEQLKSGYEKDRFIFQDISFEIGKGEILSILGNNGSGKSTIIKSIFNLTPYKFGKISFKSIDIFDMESNQIFKLGMGYYMQGGQIFPGLTIDENLNVAGIGLSKQKLETRKAQIQETFELFQKRSRVLKTSKASFLSQGEKNQLALSMVMMGMPELIILDEPSAGLSPSNLSGLTHSIKKLKKTGVTILLIEQNIKFASNLSDNIGILQKGKLNIKKN